MPDTQTQIPMEPNPAPPPNFYRRHTRSLWLSLITVALAVAAILTYILFFREVTPSPQYTGDVRLEISAPEESVSGSQISYEISFENLSNIKLTALSLEVFYPEGFGFIAATPDTQPSSATGRTTADTAAPSFDGRQFTFPDLPRGEKEKLIVVGILKGNVQEIKSITAKLHYVPENFASSFLASGDASTIMLPPEITMRVLAPTHLITGQMMKYEIEIANISIENFDDLVMELSYPSGFSFGSSVPKASSGDSIWRLPQLTFGATQKITVEGRLAERPGDDVYISAELFTQKDGEKLSAGRSYAFTRMLDAPIKLTHILRGGAGTVLASENLEYEVSYENVGDVGLSNVTIIMIFETPVFDLMEARSSTGQIRGNQMIWQPGGVAELGIVNPGQTGKFSVRLPIRAETELFQKNPVAQTRTEFRADTLQEALSGDTLAFKVGTNISLDAKAFVVSGPERPELGQTSVYRVTLTVKNSVNDLQDAVLTAIIPRTDTAFLSQTVGPAQEAGNLQYFSASRGITWKLGQVSAFTGPKQSARTITFDLSMTPETSGFGSYELLKDIEVQGLDIFTNELVFSEKIRSVDTR
ncbi:MAG: hypothetical protein A2751_05940 [Candidatus Doudnabacteria bacterium RIFCSPHIGHO2_01_FULL_46_14]|uniref:DUF11 domain-containing protein n=1 Tax=Candidatus Doudnabacteria bacterium RIFCSPHIGHO2_01_FULL_46_14 TaxID=1817824 RepID=A0A1F5NP55_9BACT|nr:MAG: hypothetical protein A2751_05940 [Candidatus Doudnabacteria bacterium RIFCSPHIGHO2_01_FULL_46_14]